MVTKPSASKERLRRLNDGNLAARLNLKESRSMSTPTQYPYDTRLNVLHQHLELIDEKASPMRLHPVVQPDALPGKRIGGPHRRD